MTDSPLLLPDGRQANPPRIVTSRDGSPTVAGLMTRNQWNQLEAILNAQYVLFRNDGGQLGERLRCRWHQADPFGLPDPFAKPVYHSHLTLMCIERPFRGMADGLWFAYRVVTEDRKGSILRALDQLPSLSTSHPETARGLAPDSSGENIFGLLLDLGERITTERARYFIERINEKNPPVRLPLPPR